jgi:hypothetical protein
MRCISSQSHGFRHSHNLFLRLLEALFKFVVDKLGIGKVSFTQWKEIVFDVVVGEDLA